MSNTLLPFQMGLFPITVAKYSNFPLTSGKTLAPTELIESFHMAMGNFRCFNAALTNEERNISFYWFNRNNVFIKGAKKVLPYTDLFWAMFFKVIARLGQLKAIILQVCLHASACICWYMHVYAGI